MAQNQQITALLDRLDQHTNLMAEQQVRQTEKITEIAKDVDDLIAGGTLDAPTLARIEALKVGLDASIAFETAQADQLTQIAAKHDAPIPPLPPQ